MVLVRRPFFTTIQYAVACLHCMVLFLRGPQKRSGLLRYGSGKDMVNLGEIRYIYPGSQFTMHLILNISS